MKTMKTKDELMRVFEDLTNIPPHMQDAKIKDWASVSNGRAWATKLSFSMLERIPKHPPDMATCEVNDKLGITLARLNLIPIRNK